MNEGQLIGQIELYTAHKDTHTHSQTHTHTKTHTHKNTHTHTQITN